MNDSIGRHDVRTGQMDALLTQKDITLEGKEGGTQWMSEYSTSQIIRDSEEPIEYTYIFRHGDGDNLIGHCLNLREASKVIYWQLQRKDKKEEDFKNKVLFSLPYQQWGYG